MTYKVKVLSALAAGRLHHTDSPFNYRANGEGGILANVDGIRGFRVTKFPEMWKAGRPENATTEKKEKYYVR